MIFLLNTKQSAQPTAEHSVYFYSFTIFNSTFTVLLKKQILFFVFTNAFSKNYLDGILLAILPAKSLKFCV